MYDLNYFKQQYKQKCMIWIILKNNAIYVVHYRNFISLCIKSQVYKTRFSIISAN